MSEDLEKKEEIQETESIVPLHTGITHKSINELKELKKFKEQLIKDILIKGEHGKGVDYGSVPGIKHMIFKEGIQTICEAFELGSGNPQLEKELTTITLDDGKTVTHYTVYAKVPIHSLTTGAIIGVGVGVCSTLESKYRYRGKERECPECGKETIIKGKEEYGGGWLCWTKKEGCGAKFDDDDPQITQQKFGKIENLNPHDVLNTVTYMSIKRGRSLIVLDATGMSKYFYLPEDLGDEGNAFEGSAEHEEKQKETEKKKYEDKEPPIKNDKDNKRKPTKVELTAFLETGLDVFGSHDSFKGWLKAEFDIDKASDIKTKKQLDYFASRLDAKGKKQKRENKIPEKDISEE